MNGNAPYRKGEYFRSELTVDNSSAPAAPSITVSAPNETAVTGYVFVPQTPESFECDDDGNLTQDGRWTYSWDAENRLVQMVTRTQAGAPMLLKFEYDAQGRRIHKRVWAGTDDNGAPAVDLRILYDRWNPVAEVGNGGALVRSYMWGTDLSGSLQGAGGVGGLLEMSYYGASTTNCFPAYDGNGNAVALVNALDGGVVARYEYGPFGEVIRETGPMARANPFRFSTKYQDDESDLLYYGYRYYNSSTGRWLSRDPIGETGGKNLYCTLRNDSISCVDQWGLITIREMDAEIYSLRQKIIAQAIPCCCKKERHLRATLRAAVVNGEKVSVAAWSVGFPHNADCPIRLLKYYWWDCYKAAEDAENAGVPTVDKGGELWKDYGWQPGGVTHNRSEVGAVIRGYGVDARHWNWSARVVYQFCDRSRGIMSVDWAPAGELQFTWSVYSPYGWTHPEVLYE